jgi:hypothetical protein
VWFTLSNESGRTFWIDPLVLVADKKLVEAPEYCGDALADDEFGKKYLRPGQTYAVVFGGARTGEISMKAVKPNESVLGAFDFRGTAAISGRVSALATNAPLNAGRESRRQAPSPADMDAALKLAKQLFAEAGVPAELLSRIKQDELTLSTLLPNKALV